MVLADETVVDEAPEALAESSWPRRCPLVRPMNAAVFLAEASGATPTVARADATASIESLRMGFMGFSIGRLADALPVMRPITARSRCCRPWTVDRGPLSAGRWPLTFHCCASSVPAASRADRPGGAPLSRARRTPRAGVAWVATAPPRGARRRRGIVALPASGPKRALPERRRYADPPGAFARTTAGMVRRFRIELVEGPAKGAVWDSSADRCSIGSSEGNDLVVADATVSRPPRDPHRRRRASAISAATTAR